MGSLDKATLKEVGERENLIIAATRTPARFLYGLLLLA